MVDRTTAALRERFYKGHLLLSETPRRGDKAAVVKSHCEPITDLMVKVRDDPVFADLVCSFCGGKHPCWAVEVELLDDLGREMEGAYVFAMPIKWLQRVLPLGHVDASHSQILMPG